MSYQPKEHEETFPVKPIGVRYICEFCGDGEMVVDPTGEAPSLMTNPPLIPHKCTKCGETMHLQRMYPFIEWQREEIDNNGTT